ncbi:MAG: DNA polymerase [Tannerellaceae bacterium]
MGCDQCSCKAYPRHSWSNLNPQHRDLMIIGESSTVQEIHKGVAFTGPGAQVMKETLAKVGMPFDDDHVYYTVALKCAVPKSKNFKIPKDSYSCCHDYLINEIKQVQPKLLIVCGATAMYTLLNTTAVKVSEEYGRVREYPSLPGIKVIPMMNPGMLLHKPGDYKPFLAMMQLASTIYNGGQAVDTGETKYIVCDTKEKCVALWKRMMALNKEGKCDYVSYDIETTGLDYRIVDFLVLGICFEKNISYVIPREMRNLVHNFLEGVPWKCIWQHGKYDKKVMWRRELGNISIDEDTMYQHYVLDETSSHDLGYLSKVYLNAAEYKYKMNQNWKVVSLETYPQFFEALCERVAVDTDYTLQLFHRFNELLEEEPSLGDLYHNFLIPAANFLSRVEQNGIYVDEAYLNVMDKQYTILLEKLKDEVEELAAPFWNSESYQMVSGAKSIPKKFNPASPQQMAWMIFDRLKLNPRIKKGRSTDKEILKSIEKPPALVSKVLEFRKVQKEHSTYVLGLLEARDNDGRVRTTFSLHITATGRLSSKEPNVQNQPSANGVGNIRKAFLPAPGYVFAEIDYSGAELRWLAVLSGDEKLNEIFHTNRNLHVETAKSLFGDHYTKAEKLRAKAMNFGIAYGREAKSIAEEHNMPLADAEKMVEDWLNLYSGARDYLYWCDGQVKQGNYMISPFGRRRRFGLVSPASLKSLQNEARNFPIQSASSDTLLKCAMECESRLLKEFDTKIINLIHDSMLLEIPADPEIVKQVGFYCNEVMTTAPKRLFDIDLPFRCDFEIGKNWSELVTFDYSDEAKAENKQVEWENKDDTVTQVSWDEWYNGGK